MTPSPLQIRLAVPTDFLGIVALERATEHAPHWPPATYAAILTPHAAAPRRCLFVVLKDGSLAGFAAGLMHPPNGNPVTSGAVQLAELESVVVAANARRAGIGRTLCKSVLDWSGEQGATEVILEVRASSAGAIALYAGLGFVHAGRRPRYYRDPNDDALVMRCQLDARPTSPQGLQGAQA
jgi:ribosomal-protein-alanine N-acetyltransferase